MRCAASWTPAQRRRRWMMSNERPLVLGALVLSVAGACGLSSAVNPPEEGAGTLQAGADPGEEVEVPPAEGSAGAPLLPVPINEGLASLDSYHMTYTSDVFDSASQTRTQTTLITDLDRESDASYNRTETRTTGEDSSEDSEAVQEQFAIGDHLCTVSDGEAEMTIVSEMAQVLSDLMSRVVVLQPLIEDPVFVGEDVVNGVPVRTYTFEVRSVEATTEVEVSRSDGAYAVAIDGDYLVHYRLDLELRSGAEGDPQAEFSTFSIEVSLEDVNLPVDIAFPDACVAADSFEE
jgi:hypothetical protein